MRCIYIFAMLTICSGANTHHHLLRLLNSRPSLAHISTQNIKCRELTFDPASVLHVHTDNVCFSEMGNAVGHASTFSCQPIGDVAIHAACDMYIFCTGTSERAFVERHVSWMERRNGNRDSGYILYRNHSYSWHIWPGNSCRWLHFTIYSRSRANVRCTCDHDDSERRASSYRQRCHRTVL